MTNFLFPHIFHKNFPAASFRYPDGLHFVGNVYSSNIHNPAFRFGRTYQDYNVPERK